MSAFSGVSFSVNRDNANPNEEGCLFSDIEDRKSDDNGSNNATLKSLYNEY